MTQAPVERRSKRGQQRYSERELTPLEQIPVLPGSDSIEATGAWAYYLRPEGATISDTLILYPNGGTPDIDDARMKVRFSENSLYYQNRQARKGFEFIGQTLTEGGVRRLVEVMAQNRPDEILFCEEEIEACKDVAKNSDIPEVRNQARRRRAQFERRLSYLTQPLDEPALIAELNEIARAQQLAKVDPAVLRVMRSMIGEVNENMAASIAHFQAGRTPGESAPTKLSKGGSDRGASFTGKDSLDA